MSDGAGFFHLILFPQARPTADLSVLRIIPPPGWFATDQHGAAAFSNGRLVFERYLAAPQSIDVRLSRR
jgi:hypothetical protein